MTGATTPYVTPVSCVSWRDPLDWPFLLSGVCLRLWCSAWEGIAAAHAEWRSW